MNDPRAPRFASVDPLLRATDAGVSGWDPLDTEPVELVPASFLGELEALVEERVQLTADLCQLLWKQHEVEAAIRRVLLRCTAVERGDELLRHCFARARQRLAPELDALELAERSRDELTSAEHWLARSVTNQE